MNTRLLKLFFVAFFVLPFSIECIAQDLIVTSDGDSLNCAITEISSDNIHFTFMYKGEVRNTLLPMSKVESYQRGHFSVAELPVETIESVKKTEFSHCRIALTGGLAYRLAFISDDYDGALRRYMRDLKSGYSYGVSATYYFNKVSGFGIKYQNFNSKNEIDGVTLFGSDGNYHVGTMSDDISISFIGPFYSSRFINSKNGNCVVLGAGLGYMGYKDDALLLTERYSLKGNTLGIVWDFGYDIALSKSIALGFQLSYYVGTMYEYEISDGNTTETVELESGEYEGLARLDFSIGLRINL